MGGDDDVKISEGGEQQDGSHTVSAKHEDASWSRFSDDVAETYVSLKRARSPRQLKFLAAAAVVIILLIMGYSALFGHSEEFNSAMQVYKTAQIDSAYIAAYDLFWQASAKSRDHDLALAYIDSIRERLTLMNLNDSEFQMALNWSDSLRNSPSRNSFRQFLLEEGMRSAGSGSLTTGILYDLSALSVDPTNINAADSLKEYVARETYLIVSEYGSLYNYRVISFALSTLRDCRAIDIVTRHEFVSDVKKRLAAYHLKRARALLSSGFYNEATEQAEIASKWDANPKEVGKLLQACENERYVSFDGLAESFTNMTDVQQEQWNKNWDEYYYVKGTGTISDIKQAGFVDQILSGISGDYYEIDLDIQNGYHAVLYFPQAGSQNWISKFYKGENISYKGRLKNLTDWGFWVTGYIVGE
jgi:hypothetical protein